MCNVFLCVLILFRLYIKILMEKSNMSMCSQKIGNIYDFFFISFLKIYLCIYIYTIQLMSNTYQKNIESYFELGFSYYVHKSCEGFTFRYTL